MNKVDVLPPFSGYIMQSEHNKQLPGMCSVLHLPLTMYLEPTPILLQSTSLRMIPEIFANPCRGEVIEISKSQNGIYCSGILESPREV